MPHPRNPFGIDPTGPWYAIRRDGPIVTSPTFQHDDSNGNSWDVQTEHIVAGDGVHLVGLTLRRYERAHTIDPVLGGIVEAVAPLADRWVDVKAADLRAVSLVEVDRHGRELAAAQLQQRAYSERDKYAAFYAERDAQAFAERPKRPSPNARYGPEHWEAVAALYVECQREHRVFGLVAAERFDVTTDVTRQWVRYCRQNGYLPKFSTTGEERPS